MFENSLVLFLFLSYICNAEYFGGALVSTGLLKCWLHAEGLVGLVKNRKNISANEEYALAA